MQRNPRRRPAWMVSSGFVLLILGFGWAITDRLLVGFYPLSWGGPNIGGGALLLLAYLAVLGGVVLLVATEVERRLPGSEVPQRGVGWWSSLSLGVLLAAGWGTVTILKPGDASLGINGQVGVTVSDVRDPVLVLEICRGSTTEVAIYGPNRGTVPNEVLARYRATSAATAELLFDLSHPPAGWVAESGLPGLAGRKDLMIAIGSGEQSELQQATFTAVDVSGVRPGTVLFSDGQTQQTGSLADFHSLACD